MGLLATKGIVKTFPGGVRANDSIDFHIRQGEIHALLGENGAGKTTLMNVIYGMCTPDAGQVFFKGRRVTITSPRAAINLGIGMVHQHFMLAPDLTVAENIILGFSGTSPLLRPREMEREVARLAAAYGLDVNPRARVESLPVGAQQRVEILKALYREVDLLILDEPTAVLAPHEIRDLFKVLRKLAQEGKSVILISHKLDEVMEISDRITVLRDGRVAGVLDTSAVTPEGLANLMVGREMSFSASGVRPEPGQPLLATKGLTVTNKAQTRVVDQVDLVVRSGEILGLAGIDGNGQRELMETLVGLTRASAGTVTILGQDVTAWSTKRILSLGVGFVPPDRQTAGLVLDLPVSDNLILSEPEQFSRRGVLDRQAINSLAKDLVSEFDIRPPVPANPAHTLSGGNQQKLVMARVLSRRPQVLLISQATRGLDVGATEFIHRRVHEERTRGAAAVYVTTDLDEVLKVSDRVCVMFRGKLSAPFTPGQLTIEQIGLLMVGSGANGRGPVVA